jgi:WD40 repeat protein
MTNSNPALSADNQISYVEPNYITIWDMQSGKSLGKIKLNEDCPNLTFLPASHILAGGIGKQVLIWDADTRKQIVSLQVDHSQEVISLAFSPDGTSLASTDTNGSVLLWRINP